MRINKPVQFECEKKLQEDMKINRINCHRFLKRKTLILERLYIIQIFKWIVKSCISFGKTILDSIIFFFKDFFLFFI